MLRNGGKSALNGLHDETLGESWARMSSEPLFKWTKIKKKNTQNYPKIRTRNRDPNENRLWFFMLTFEWSDIRLPKFSFFAWCLVTTDHFQMLLKHVCVLFNLFSFAVIEKKNKIGKLFSLKLFIHFFADNFQSRCWFDSVILSQWIFFWKIAVFFYVMMQRKNIIV